MYVESKTRAILKTLTWRITATVTTITLVYIFVGELMIAAAIGGVEVVAKLVLYFFHERAWNAVNMGKKPAHEPFVLWFTGLSGSGKSTLANKTYEYLQERGIVVDRLDGDTIRDIFPRTGFTKDERNAHIKRVGYLASRLEKKRVTVVASFISPYAETRNFVRSMCTNFIEVHVATPIEECEKRDIKGLYQKARDGEIDNFTGISSPYEEPQKPEICINTTDCSVDDCFEEIKKYIRKYI